MIVNPRFRSWSLVRFKVLDHCRSGQHHVLDPSPLNGFRTVSLERRRIWSSRVQLLTFGFFRNFFTVVNGRSFVTFFFRVGFGSVQGQFFIVGCRCLFDRWLFPRKIIGGVRVRLGQITRIVFCRRLQFCCDVITSKLLGLVVFLLGPLAGCLGTFGVCGYY